MLTIASIKPKVDHELKIAITGHRQINISDVLINSINSTLEDLLDQFIESDIYLLSPLAEGSDQLVAKLAMQFPGVKLIVPLPLSVDEYLEDFSSDDSKQQFLELLKIANKIIPLTPVKNHQMAYHNLGEYLVNECDSLLAIWNGIYTNKIGGSGEVVRMAVTTKKPVFWIYNKTI
jgi:hypothetical protein